MTFAVFSGGRAKTTMKEVTTTAQTNTGIRASVIPGARSLSAVTMKFTAPAVVETPRKSSERQ